VLKITLLTIIGKAAFCANLSEDFMKLFQRLLVAPAALGLMAPIAANAAELNIQSVSDYSSSNEQVSSASQFTDLQPTDWAYQALANLVESQGCVASYSANSFTGNRAITRYEAAALLNSCLENISEVNDDVKRLLNEFNHELATLKGRIDGVEADIGSFEAGAFSTTTKLSGSTVFTMGGIDGVSGSEAVHFNYDTKIDLDSSFTGEDLLKTRLRAGNFSSSTPFSGTTALETAYDSSDSLKIDRAYYQFPLGDSITATVGAVVRQDDMLGVWPSSYPSDSILDVLTYAGANAAYNLSEGSGAGITYAQDNLSASLAIVSENGSDASKGVLTEEGSDDITAQLAWVGDNFTVAAAYTSSDGGNTTGAASAEDFDAWGISAQYDLDNGISLNAGLGWKTPDTENDASNIEDESTWSVGVVWSDLGSEGNNLGFAIGTAEGHRDDSGYDDPLAYEIYYSMAVSDNVTVTPAYFNVERDGADDISGALVKTTFTF